MYLEDMKIMTPVKSVLFVYRFVDGVKETTKIIYEDQDKQKKIDVFINACIFSLIK